MATLLDATLVGHFSTIFVFLFVFVIVYGFLSVTNIFKQAGGAKGLYAIIALAAAFFMAISGNTLKLLTTMTPWFIALVIFVFLVFLVVKMFSGDDDTLFKELIKQKPVYWVLVVLFVIILIVSLSSTYGQSLLEKQQPQQDVVTTVQQPTTIQEPVQVTQQQVTVVESQTTLIGDQSTQDTSFSNNVLKTIVHPKVLGMILLLIIGFFTILFMAQTSDPS